MTLAEKAGQLSCFTDEVRPVGAIFNPVVNAQGAEAQLAAIRARATAARANAVLGATGPAGTGRARHA